MGLKDHVDDGLGHILDQGLDLDYLHVESMDRQPVVSAARAGAKHSSGSSSPGESEESAESDGEVEHRHSDPQPPVKDPEQADVLQEYRNKMEFALKLGYSEELVQLVLRKLGAEALINDILGELVKLGSKQETEHALQSSSSSSSSSSTSSPSGNFRWAPAAQGADSPPQQEVLGDQDNLRPVVLDGSNVAMSHGNKEVFSCRGIQLAVDWFLDRGHKDVTVFVPAWRKEQSRPDALITDQEILRRLEKEKILVFTPSRRVQGRRVVCYDDRFIVKLAYESDGIIVSNDNYRDLANEKPEWKKFIDERLLMYSFVNDKFMPPDDPLGRHGPSLDNFLRKRPIIPEHKKQPCPYGKKCTYGHKCKFHHPERSSQPQRSVADELRASARASGTRGQGEPGLVKSHSAPLSSRPEAGGTGDNSRCPALKRQSEPSMRVSSCVEVEEQLGRRTPSESHLRSSGPSPTPAALTQDVRAPAATPFSWSELYPRCASPNLSYYSLVGDSSALGLSLGRSPDRRFPPEGSGSSDCSSEGSVSCGSSDSYGEHGCMASPELPLDDGLKCRHHQRCPPYSCGHPPPLHRQPQHHLRHHAAHHSPYHAYSQGLVRIQNLSLEDGSPLHKHSYLMSHPPVAARSSCPGDCLPVPPTPPHLQGSSPGHSHTAARSNGPSDPRLYKQSPARAGRSYPGADSCTAWDSYPPPHLYSPAQPCYQPFGDSREQAWLQPWGYPGKTAPSPARQASEPPPLSRYQDMREKVFVNLCNIFSPELVRVVMGKNPHMTDAQQLAAAILAEKSMGY